VKESAPNSIVKAKAGVAAVPTAGKVTVPAVNAIE